jgi:hypothetical protein
LRKPLSDENLWEQDGSALARVEHRQLGAASVDSPLAIELTVEESAGAAERPRAP